jgi:hypothetical protein
VWSHGASSCTQGSNTTCCLMPIQRLFSSRAQQSLHVMHELWILAGEEHLVKLSPTLISLDKSAGEPGMTDFTVQPLVSLRNTHAKSTIWMYTEGFSDLKRYMENQQCGASLACILVLDTHAGHGRKSCPLTCLRPFSRHASLGK